MDFDFFLKFSTGYVTNNLSLSNLNVAMRESADLYRQPTSII